MGRRTLLIVVTAMGALTLLAIGAVVAGLLRPPRRTEAIAYAQVGKTTLAVPADYTRGGADPKQVIFDRLDLAAFLPDFKPAGRMADVRPGADMAERAERVAFVTLTPNDGSLDPADRPVRLYARFLDPIGYQNPGGLVRRRFQDDSPYQGEELYMALPEGRAFWARCPRREARPGVSLDACLWETRMEGLDIAVRFSSTRLTEWETIAEGVRGMVKSFLR